MTMSSIYRDKLDFLSAYVSALEEGGRFAADQVVSREIASLKRAGYTDTDRAAIERMTDIQCFAIEAMETLRAQMVVLIWVFHERFLDDALESLRMSANVATRFNKRRLRGKSFVDNARQYIEDILQVNLSISDKEWATLSDLQQIRHFLAHRGHRPGARPDGAQLDAVNRQSGLKVAIDGIVVSPEFLTRQIDFSKTFIRKFDGDHWEQSERFDLDRF